MATTVKYFLRKKGQVSAPVVRKDDTKGIENRLRAEVSAWRKERKENYAALQQQAAAWF